MEDRLDVIINHYKKEFGKNSDRCISYIKTQKSLPKAITVASLSVDEFDKKDPHQYHIPKATLESWSDANLMRLPLLKKAKTFDEIHNILTGARIKGIGKVTVYDTAVRIGIYKKLYPQKIYLHAGTKEGAEELLGKTSSNDILKSKLPEQFQRKDLSCLEIEDILCIYKDILDPSLDQKSFYLGLVKISSKYSRRKGAGGC
jgi:hypothetical protein